MLAFANKKVKATRSKWVKDINRRAINTRMGLA